MAVQAKWTGPGRFACAGGGGRERASRRRLKRRRRNSIAGSTELDARALVEMCVAQLAPNHIVGNPFACYAGALFVAWQRAIEQINCSQEFQLRYCHRTMAYIRRIETTVYITPKAMRTNGDGLEVVVGRVRSLTVAKAASASAPRYFVATPPSGEYLVLESRVVCEERNHSAA